MSSNTNQSSQQIQSMSLESVFVAHYLNALQNFQNIWLNAPTGEGLDTLKFNIQFEYLIRLLPDRVMQENIRQAQLEAIELFKASKDDYPEQRAALVVVTKIIEFICQSFDLTHIDITGGATDEQAIIESRIPDKPTPETILEV